MVKAIAPMWEDEQERRLFKQMHDLGHRVNSTLMHHSGPSLGRNVTITEAGGTFNAGRSESYLAAALGMAFWIYVQMLSLVLSKERNKELSAMYIKHRDIYSKARQVERDEAAANPVDPPAEARC